jgi:hypothetical protein
MKSEIFKEVKKQSKLSKILTIKLRAFKITQKHIRKSQKIKSGLPG